MKYIGSTEDVTGDQESACLQCELYQSFTLLKDDDILPWSAREYFSNSSW